MSMNNVRVLKRILKFTKPYVFYLILSLVMAIIYVAATLYTPILTGKGIDLIIAGG